MFDHHTAEYNLEKIIENLILLQEHYAGNRCGDCILKHLETIRAYADEGMTLDHSDKYMQFLKASYDLAEKHLDIVVGCIEEGECKVKSEEDIHRMIQEVRELRREINMALYGMVGDTAIETIKSDLQALDRDVLTPNATEEHLEQEHKREVAREHEENARKHGEL